MVEELEVRELVLYLVVMAVLVAVVKTLLEGMEILHQYLHHKGIQEEDLEMLLVVEALELLDLTVHQELVVLD